MLDERALVDALPDEEVMALLQAMWKVEDAEKFGRFASIFPATGPRARHLYAKHMEFFSAGATFRERCFMAGNQIGKCRTYNDLINHPDGSIGRIGDLFYAAQPFDVATWKDGSMASAPAIRVVRKPAEPCVEVLLESGHTFTASLGHLVLTDVGYASLWMLLTYAPCLPACGEAFVRSTRGAGDLHWSETPPDWTDHCEAFLRRDGGRPRWVGGDGQDAPPSPADAQGRTRPWSAPDDLVGRGSGIRRLSSSLLSNSDGRLRCAARSAEFLARAACMFAPRRKGSPKERLLPGAGSIRELRSSLEAANGLCGRAALVSPCMAGNRIVAYRPIGVHDLYDLEVEGTHNYVADGIVHHNTTAGAYEVTCHLTGLYPDWWVGRRFRHPVRAWAAGDYNETTRDIVQKELLGEVSYLSQRKGIDGTGMIPTEHIGREAGQLTWKAGVADLIDTVKIRHVPTGGWSTLGLKSYMQGRKSFQGTKQHLIWFDEEPPQDVYGEALIRTATTGGITLLTFTPLSGMSEVVLGFLPEEMRPDAG